MGLVFWLTFGVIGAALQGLMEDGIAAIIASADAGLKAFGTNDVVQMCIRDRVWALGTSPRMPLRVQSGKVDAQGLGHFVVLDDDQVLALSLIHI